MSIPIKENLIIPEKYEPEKEARPSGFTLTETICSLFLLGALLVFMITSFRLVDLQNRKTEQYQIALIEVSNIMETLASENWENLTSETSDQTKISPSAEKSLPNSALKTTITESKEIPQAKKISLTLTFNNSNGQPAPAVQLTSWVYQQESAE